MVEYAPGLDRCAGACLHLRGQPSSCGLVAAEPAEVIAVFDRDTAEGMGEGAGDRTHAEHVRRRRCGFLAISHGWRAARSGGWSVGRDSSLCTSVSERISISLSRRANSSGSS